MKPETQMRRVPVLRITDPRFVYVDSASTDIRKTFARERARLLALHTPGIVCLTADIRKRFAI